MNTYLQKIEQLKPSAVNLNILLKETVAVEVSDLSQEDIARCTHLSAALSLVVAHEKLGQPLDGVDDVAKLVYGDDAPHLLHKEFAKGLCMLASPEIGIDKANKLILVLS